jgi:hypothetical protein
MASTTSTTTKLANNGEWRPIKIQMAILNGSILILTISTTIHIINHTPSPKLLTAQLVLSRRSLDLDKNHSLLMILLLRVLITPWKLATLNHQEDVLCGVVFPTKLMCPLSHKNQRQLVHTITIVAPTTAMTQLHTIANAKNLNLKTDSFHSWQISSHGFLLYLEEWSEN